jgi:hypothetical protein
MRSRGWVLAGALALLGCGTITPLAATAGDSAAPATAVPDAGAPPAAPAAPEAGPGPDPAAPGGKDDGMGGAGDDAAPAGSKKEPHDASAPKPK